MPVEVPFVVNAAKKSNHLALHVPVGRYQKLGATEYIGGIDVDHPVEIGLREVDFRSAHEVDDLAAPEIFGKYVLFYPAENRGGIEVIGPAGRCIGCCFTHRPLHCIFSSGLLVHAVSVLVTPRTAWPEKKQQAQPDNDHGSYVVSEVGPRENVIHQE